MDDLRRLKQLDAQREQDFAALDATRDAFQGVPDEELEREVTRALLAARQKARSGSDRSADRS